MFRREPKSTLRVKKRKQPVSFFYFSFFFDLPPSSFLSSSSLLLQSSNSMRTPPLPPAEIVFFRWNPFRVLCTGQSSLFTRRSLFTSSCCRFVSRSDQYSFNYLKTSSCCLSLWWYLCQHALMLLLAHRSKPFFCSLFHSSIFTRSFYGRKTCLERDLISF